MKYIRTYERMESNLNYKVGDYVEVRMFGGDSVFMKIIKIGKKFEGKRYDYGCEIVDKGIQHYDIYEYPFPVNEESIIRKVEEYEIDAKKYNL